jgi:hypothetical protein
MKKSLLLAVFVVITAVLAVWLLSPRESGLPLPPDVPPQASAAQKPLAAVQKASPPAVPPSSQPSAPPVVPPPVPRPPPADAAPARIEADTIALNLRHYGQRFGGNPTGTNAEIVKTLNGGNPQGVRYLPQEHLHLNDQGELLDTWGTPYFFHQMSAQQMEIRSAGPDKTLWTRDDIIAQ